MAKNNTQGEVDMTTKQEVVSKGKENPKKALIDQARRLERDKDSATLKLGEILYQIKRSNAHNVVGYPADKKGFQEFCGAHMSLGYHSAMRYIAIYEMVVDCGIAMEEADAIGYSKLRILPGVLNPDNANILLDNARTMTTAAFEEYIKQYKKSLKGEEGDGSDSGELSKARKFVFPASEEEVGIIQEGITDVKTLLGTSNDTNALVHIIQGYMEFAYPLEREQTLKAKAGKVKKETTPEVKAEPKAEPKKEKVKTEVEDKVVEKPAPAPKEEIISEAAIPTATLPQLLAFAEAKGIVIDEKIANSKPRVKSAIINSLGTTTEPEAVEEVVEAPAPKVEPKPEKKEKKKESKKATEKVSEPEVVAEEVEESTVSAEQVTIEDAITMLRDAETVDDLTEILESFSVDPLKGKKYDKMPIAEFREECVKALCATYDEEYIAPSEEDDTDDIDKLIAGE